jgi:hypothetical protein
MFPDFLLILDSLIEHVRRTLLVIEHLQNFDLHGKSVPS